MIDNKYNIISACLVFQSLLCTRVHGRDHASLSVHVSCASQRLRPQSRHSHPPSPFAGRAVATRSRGTRPSRATDNLPARKRQAVHHPDHPRTPGNSNRRRAPRPDPLDPGSISTLATQLAKRALCGSTGTERPVTLILAEDSKRVRHQCTTVPGLPPEARPHETNLSNQPLSQRPIRG